MNKRMKAPYETHETPPRGDNPLSAHQQQLEQLLGRIEQAVTHYQVLNVDRSATAKQIGQAYRQAMVVMYPFRDSTGTNVPADTQKRVNLAVGKVALAGAILLNLGKRIEYDNLLSRRTTATLPSRPLRLLKNEMPSAGAPSVAKPAKPQEQQETAHRDSKTVLAQDDVNRQLIATPPPVGSVLASDMPEDNRRRGERFKLSIPVYVTGHHKTGGKWQEIAKTINVSRFGAAIDMTTRMPQGSVLHLLLPLPSKLRTHGYADHTYKVYAIVRRVHSTKGGRRTVAVEFLGERPPAGYFDKPGGVFRTTEWQGVNRRREPRTQRAQAVRLEYLNYNKEPIRDEQTMTENVSRSGMRVLAKTAPAEFDYVRVRSLGDDRSALAAVCDRYMGKDGVERLCLNFLDAGWEF